MADDGWERHKATIIHAYAIEERPLKKVMDMMKEKHSFDKSKQQYEYRLKKWRVRKNVTEDVWKFVSHRIRKREGKPTKVLLYGKTVSEDRVQKEILRYTTLPTASQFGVREPSPMLLDGDIVQVRSPSIIGSDFWPQNLPWFRFESRLLNLTSNFSGFLEGFYSEVGVAWSFSRLKMDGNLVAIFSAANNPQVLREVIRSQLRSIPTSHLKDDEQCEALTRTEDAQSMSRDLLRLIFFHLSNDSVLEYTEAQTQVHDRFVLALFELVSKSNPQFASDLLSQSCFTTNAIRESLFASAIRDRSYAMVERLLKAGVDPNLPLQCPLYFFELRYRRGIYCVSFPHLVRPTFGISIAARHCDIRLAEILLQAGANANSLDGVNMNLGRIGLSPLTWLARKHLDSQRIPADSITFFRLLIQYGGGRDPGRSIQRHLDRPFLFAIAEQKTELIDLLTDCGAFQDTENHENCACSRRGWQSDAIAEATCRFCSPLEVAIGSTNLVMVERLLKAIFQGPEQGCPHCVRRIVVVSCFAGDMDTVAKLLTLNIDFDDNWAFGITPLVAAAWNSGADFNEQLLKISSVGPKAGDAVTSTTTPTPLHVAAYYGNAKLVRQLIEHGADCNVLFEPLLSERSPAPPHRLSLFEWLKSNDPKARPSTHYEYQIRSLNWLIPERLWDKRRGVSASPLQLAISENHLDTITLLLPRSRLRGDELVDAMRLDDKLVRQLLSLGASIWSTRQDGTNALEAAAEQGNSDFINLYFESGGQYRSRALYLATQTAIRVGDHSILNLMLEHRPLGVTDSHEASAIILTILEDEWDLLDLLCLLLHPSPVSSFYIYSQESEFLHNDYAHDHQEFPDTRGNGITPLFAACLSDDSSVTKRLTNRGWTVQESDLRVLAGRWMPHLDEDVPSMIKAYLQPLVTPRARDNTWNRHAVYYAIQTDDMEKLRLCVAFADSLDFQVNYLVTQSPSGKPGFSPLGMAVEKGRLDMIDLLLDAGANIEYPSYWNDTVLQGAVSSKNIAIVKHLVDRGADVNAPAYDYWGSTALQSAVERGNIEGAKFLLEHGANIDAMPAKIYGRTALEQAASYGRLDMIQLLFEKGVQVWGDKRPHFIRAVGLARDYGHYVAESLLKDHGSWTEKDQRLRDSRHILSDYPHFEYDRDSDEWDVWSQWSSDISDSEYESSIDDDDDVTKSTYEGSEREYKLSNEGDDAVEADLDPPEFAMSAEHDSEQQNVPQNPGPEYERDPMADAEAVEQATEENMVLLAPPSPRYHYDTERWLFDNEFEDISLGRENAQLQEDPTLVNGGVQGFESGYEPQMLMPLNDPFFGFDESDFTWDDI
ncbi:hypothetical protein GGR57DRAFT_520789 [Xylariaceae sp. FL1272]|nr:hypothetical protein GGR57DRAFT_520789 [Xylariaceae sp. FL1272]